MLASFFLKWGKNVRKLFFLATMIKRRARRSHGGLRKFYYYIILFYYYSILGKAIITCKKNITAGTIVLIFWCPNETLESTKFVKRLLAGSQLLFGLESPRPGGGVGCALSKTKVSTVSKWTAEKKWHMANFSWERGIWPGSPPARIRVLSDWRKAPSATAYVPFAAGTNTEHGGPGGPHYNSEILAQGGCNYLSRLVDVHPASLPCDPRTLGTT